MIRKYLTRALSIIKALLLEGQQRLLDSRRIKDYFFVTIIALLPIGLSVMLGIWNPTLDVTQGGHLGFNRAYNFWAHVLILPLELFLLRNTYDLLFGNLESSQNLLVKFKDKKIQEEIHRELKSAVINPVLPFQALCINLIFHYFDVGEVLREYILGFQGKTVQEILSQRPIYWGNLWLADEAKIDITTNFLFTLIAYCGQFIAVFLPITGLMILLVHNIFYLKRIFQRSRSTVQKKGEEYFIVLDLQDRNRRFGLLELNPIFNRQLILLIVAGIICLTSRLTVVPQDKFFQISNLTIPNLRNFLPEFGQWVIVSAWLFGFIIILLPSVVKFLPLFSMIKFPDRLSVGIDSYLKEFVPSSKDDQYPLNTSLEIDAVARLFARNSFWPIGDEVARFLFCFVFIVALSVLFPPKWDLSTIAIILMVGFVLGYLFFIIYKWILGNVDSRLVQTYPDSGTEITNINTEGGAVIKGSVYTQDFTGRDRSDKAQ